MHHRPRLNLHLGLLADAAGRHAPIQYSNADTAARRRSTHPRPDLANCWTKLAGCGRGDVVSQANTFYVGPAEEPDKYRLVQQVGSGGEAQLWKAELAVSGQWEPVAVKILRPDRLADIDRWTARWAEQAELLRFIRHPGVVGVREHFEGGQMHYAAEEPPPPRALYLVMNWVEGVPLREWVPLHYGPDAYFESLRYLAQVGDVLDWLHSGQVTPSGRPVIHADVTPANVLVTPAGQAVLVDFGLTRLATGTSAVVEGTGGYMAPEVLATGAYSPASDRYSFGALTYFVLTGQNPPADRNGLRAGLTAIDALNSQPGLIDHLMTEFDPDPAARPAAGQWIRFFRMSGTTSLGSPGGLQPTVPMATPTAVIGEAARAPSRRRTPFLAGAIVLVAVLLLTGTVYALTRGGGTPQHAADTHSTETTSARIPPPTASTVTTTSTSTPTSPPSPTTSPPTAADTDPACATKPGPNLEGQDFSGQQLTSQGFACADAAGVNFTNTNLNGTDFDHANLAGAILTGASAAVVTFMGANLRGAKLIQVQFAGTFDEPGANFNSADLTDADLTGAQLGDETNRPTTSLIGANLSGADLTGSDLDGVNLSSANLTGANLANADLTSANLTQAQLSGANFDGATFNDTICPDGTVTSTGPCPTG